MKRLIHHLSLTAILCLCIPFLMAASNKPVPHRSAEQQRANVLMMRLQHIKQMKLIHTNKSEKLALRNEVKSAQKELNELGGGIYLSIGAIIIILLLLVVLL